MCEISSHLLPSTASPPPEGGHPAASPRRLGSYVLDLLLRGVSWDSGGCCYLVRVHLTFTRGTRRAVSPPPDRARRPAFRVLANPKHVAGAPAPLP